MKTISPYGPDAGHAQLRPGCEMTLERNGQKNEYQCKNQSGGDTFPKQWSDYKLYLLEDRLVGAEPMLIDGEPYLIEIGMVHMVEGQHDLIECRYTSLNPTKSHNGVWHAPD